MIQRIQSIFLLLAAGAFFALFGLPLAYTDQPAASLFADKVYEITDNPILMGLAIMGGAIAMLNIFMFRNRSLQLRLGFLIIIFSILLPAVAVLLVYQEGSVIGEQVGIDDGLGLYAPLAALIFGLLANYFIRKDEKLVRSADRLR